VNGVYHIPLTNQLGGKLLSLLIALQESPMARIEQLASRVNNSRTTVSRDLKWLSGEHSKSSRRYFRVGPELCESALGLETVDTFLETSQFDSLLALERICDAHPYTKYRARCFGTHSGLFVQFRIPIGTIPHIELLLKKLKAQKTIQKYSILPTIGVDSIFSVTRLEHWNRESFTWDFDWKKWAKTKGRKSTKDTTSPLPLTDLLESRDIDILNQLGFGARRKQKTIIEALKIDGVQISSQDFSRHLALLNEKFIRGYIVYLDTDAFDLYSNVILTASCKPEFAEELEMRMKSNPIPFQSTLKVKDGFLLWFLRLPPSHLSTFLAYLQERVTELNLSLLDYLSSQVYGVWSAAFDESTKSWIDTPKFMVHDILK
jgi:DNA-binding Lrp family transcriptional regulator